MYIICMQVKHLADTLWIAARGWKAFMVTTSPLCRRGIIFLRDRSPQSRPCGGRSSGLCCDGARETGEISVQRKTSECVRC